MAWSETLMQYSCTTLLTPALYFYLPYQQTENGEWQARYMELQGQFDRKLKEMANLAEELDKVKSVLQHKLTRGKPDILATVQVTGRVQGQ